MADQQAMQLRALAAAVRERRVSAHELVSGSLRRIAELDRDLGAVIAVREDEALQDARALDVAIADGADVGPLAGLPLLVKDMTDVAGMRTTFGSRAFAGAPAARTTASSRPWWVSAGPRLALARTMPTGECTAVTCVRLRKEGRWAGARCLGG